MDDAGTETHEGVIAVITPDRHQLKNIVHQTGHSLTEGELTKRIVGKVNKGTRQKLTVWVKNKGPQQKP